MPVVVHTELEKYVQKTERTAFAPVYLICGETYLCKTAFDLLLKALLPESSQSLNYESFDGSDDILGKALQSINTYSLLVGGKVVAIRDARLFYSRQDEGKLLAKIRTTFQAGHLKRAAKLFTGLLALQNLTYEDVAPATRAASLKLEAHQIPDGEWLDRIVAFCNDTDLVIPSGQDDPSLLQAAIEKGFPRQHHLILTTEVFDRRRSLFKTIRANGVVVDCSVPKGTRQADKAAQEAVLNNTMQMILKQHGKRIEREANQLLSDMTGFDLTAFTNNLQKLIDYIGDRHDITVNDVEAVVRRTKTDPIYAFTNALADRSIANALFFLESLLADNIHPLQVLAAMTNQIRKLLVAKDFEHSPHGRDWHAGITYRQFQQQVVPAIQAHDRALLTHLQAWEQDRRPQGQADDPAKRKANTKKTKTPTDLLLAKNPKNAYPIFQTLLKAANFSMPELAAAMDRLSRVDLTMKTTRQDAKIVIEKALLDICGFERT